MINIGWDFDFGDLREYKTLLLPVASHRQRASFQSFEIRIGKMQNGTMAESQTGSFIDLS
jgi:hypothetical protein